MTAKQIITLPSSHFCLLSLTENIKTEINNITIPARILNYKKHNHNGSTSRIVGYYGVIPMPSAAL